MANVIIKDSDRDKRVQKILTDFGHDPKFVSSEAREKAEYIAEKCHEIAKK